MIDTRRQRRRSQTWSTMYSRHSWRLPRGARFWRNWCCLASSSCSSSWWSCTVGVDVREHQQEADDQPGLDEHGLPRRSAHPQGDQAGGRPDARQCDSHLQRRASAGRRQGAVCAAGEGKDAEGPAQETARVPPHAEVGFPSLVRDVCFLVRGVVHGLPGTPDLTAPRAETWAPQSNCRQTPGGTLLTGWTVSNDQAGSTGVPPVSHRPEACATIGSTGVPPVNGSTGVPPVNGSTGVPPVSHRPEACATIGGTGASPVSLEDLRRRRGGLDAQELPHPPPALVAGCQQLVEPRLRNSRRARTIAFQVGGAPAWLRWAPPSGSGTMSSMMSSALRRGR